MPERQQRHAYTGRNTNVHAPIEKSSAFIKQVLALYVVVGKSDLKIDVTVPQVCFFRMVVIVWANIVARPIADDLHARIPFQVEPGHALGELL